MSQTRRLVGYVDAVGPDGRSHCFGPGDELPAWAYETITNPHVWEDALAEPPEADGEPDTGAQPPEPTEPPADPDPNEDPIGTEGEDQSDDPGSGSDPTEDDNIFDGKIDDILSWVGDDEHAPARAAAALEAELAKDKPRPTLIESLQKIAGASGDEN